MQAPIKHLDSAVNPCVFSTYELHSAGRWLETMPLSMRGMSRVNDVTAVPSPLRMAFSRDLHPSKLTQVLLGKRVANGINPWASMALCHSQCHSEPLCDTESQFDGRETTTKYTSDTKESTPFRFVYLVFFVVVPMTNDQ